MKISHLVENAKTFEDLIIQIIAEAENYSRFKRACGSIEDKEFILSLIIKTIIGNGSGLEFLQKLKQNNIINPEGVRLKIEQPSSTFFDNLNSARRGKYISEISLIILQSIANYIDEKNVDYLKDFKELDGRSIFSGDGHYAKHATHTKKIKGKLACFGTIYTQDMRNGLIHTLATVYSDTSSKPNELPIIREHLEEYIANNDLIKPVIIYDRACMDYTFWTSTEKERENGSSIITMLKSNTKLKLIEELEIDNKNLYNAGVLEYSKVELSNGGIMYYVKYKDPETDKIYEYICSDNSLKPGTIVFLYKLRWNIEKVFDVFKNKLHQTKAWATSKVAHQTQANIIALTYNIMHMIEINLQENYNIKELKLIKKRGYALEIRKKKAENNNKQIHPFEYIFNHIFQMSEQFVGTFRNAILHFVDWNIMKTLFKGAMEKYT